MSEITRAEEIALESAMCLMSCALKDYEKEKHETAITRIDMAFEILSELKKRRED